MKKLKMAVFLAVSLLLLAGCSGAGTANVDPFQLADDLKAGLTFKDEMTEASDKVWNRLYGLSEEDLVAGKVYLSTGATAEEVAVFKAVDKAAAGRIYQAAQERVDSQKAAFEDYMPAEMAKLEKPLLVQKGDIVVLCIADDTAPASDKVKDALG